MSAIKPRKINGLDLNDPQIINLIKKLLEESAVNLDELFSRLDEAQNPSQRFLQETEFTI
jgi:hypothetical protein